MLIYLSETCGQASIYTETWLQNEYSVSYEKRVFQVLGFFAVSYPSRDLRHFHTKRLILLNCSAVSYARRIWVLSFLTLKKIDYWFLIHRCLIKKTAIIYIMYRKGFGIAIHYPGAARIGHFVDSSYNLLRLFLLSLIYNWWIKNWICYIIIYKLENGQS